MDTTTQNQYIDYLKNVRLSEKILDDVKKEHFYKGIHKEKIEVVLKSYDNGISIALISNITNLSEEEVMEILREHGKVQ